MSGHTLLLLTAAAAPTRKNALSYPNSTAASNPSPDRDGVGRPGAISPTVSLPRRQRHLPELDLAVVPLEQDRPRLPLLAINRPAGDAGDRLPVDHPLAVEDDGHHPPDQGDLERLPLARFLGRIDRRGEEAVHAADLVAVRLLAKIVLDLHLVPAAQVDAAVAPLRVAELGGQLEIGQ